MEGKVVLITGASSGLGAGTAKKFSRHGACVVITGRDVDRLKTVEEECKKLGAKDVLALIAEFRKMSDVKNVLDKTIEKFGRLDVLVNNAGMNIVNCFENVKMEDFDVLFQVNVRSMFYLTQLAIPHLIESKGNVVNVSSIASITHRINNIAYGMTKAAVDQFTKTIALQYAPKGVRINAVNPSFVETQIRRTNNWSEEDARQFFQDVKQHHPIGRLGTPVDVADAIFFLSSDSASWITGHCLVIDGGVTLQTP